jgi:hypothetical protein
MAARALVIGTLLAAPAFAADPFAGTWVMNTAASSYMSGDLPQAMTIELDVGERGERYRSRTVRANRTLATAEYTADYDGRLAMVIGDLGLLSPVSLKRLGTSTVEATYKRAFQTIAHSVRVVSADARTMTITTTINGEAINAVNIGVYSKIR